MGSVTVRVDGLKELQKAMQSLGRKTSNRIAVKAMRKGGAIVRDKARSLAPVLKESVPHRRAGTLRKSIQSRTKVGKNGRTDAYIWVKGLSTKQVLKFKGKGGKSSAYNPRDPFTGVILNLAHLKCPRDRLCDPPFSNRRNRRRKPSLTHCNKNNCGGWQMT
ncbi:HK97 gp10 family phage protein [Aggregatibacter segnis]